MEHLSVAAIAHVNVVAAQGDTVGFQETRALAGGKADQIAIRVEDANGAESVRNENLAAVHRDEIGCD